MEKNIAVIPVERIERLIFLIRGQRVMLDRHLAVLYGVSTKVLNQAVKRNKGRFPEDFMFQLTTQEARVWWADVMAPRLRSQNVTLKRGQHIKYAPYAFMEHGILMLSSVLNSERAVQVNIEIMRAFVRLRQVLSSHRELARKLEELERHLRNHDEQIEAIFDAIRQLMTRPERDRKQIGFHLKERHSPLYGKSKKETPKLTSSIQILLSFETLNSGGIKIKDPTCTGVLFSPKKEEERIPYYRCLPPNQRIPHRPPCSLPY